MFAYILSLQSSSSFLNEILVGSFLIVLVFLMKLNIVILDISSTRTHSTITNQYQSSTTIITFKTFFFYFSVGFFWTLFFFFYLIIDRPTEERFHDERTTMDMDLLGLLVLPFSFVRSLSLDIFSFCFFNFMYACTLDWIFTGSSTQGSNFLEETQHLSFAIAKDYFLTFLHV